MESLERTGMLENSVILFSTDNGGAVESSSNKPLRGNKESVYEGGVRGVGLLAGGALPPLQSHQSDQSVRSFLSAESQYLHLQAHLHHRLVQDLPEAGRG